MKAWINGQVLEPDQARVSALDHGLTVGDGVFETLKFVDGAPFALTRHLARLARSCAAMGLPVSISSSCGRLWSNCSRSMQRRSGTLESVGCGSRSLAGPATRVDARNGRPAADPGTVAGDPLASFHRRRPRDLAPQRTLSHRRRQEHLLRGERRRAGSREIAWRLRGVVLNTKGQLCEGTGSNVFIERGGQLVTPPLSSGCLAGVTRELVLEWCDAEEQMITESDLLSAAEVALTSSTRDVHPVHALDGGPLVAPGPATLRAMTAFTAGVKDDNDPWKPALTRCCFARRPPRSTPTTENRRHAVRRSDGRVRRNARGAGARQGDRRHRRAPTR